MISKFCPFKKTRIHSPSKLSWRVGVSGRTASCCEKCSLACLVVPTLPKARLTTKLGLIGICCRSRVGASCKTGGWLSSTSRANHFAGGQYRQGCRKLAFKPLNLTGCEAGHNCCLRGDRSGDHPRMSVGRLGCRANEKLTWLMDRRAPCLGKVRH